MRSYQSSQRKGGGSRPCTSFLKPDRNQSPSPGHLGFGVGNHACPGRFFAANEIKIFLCHMLLNYAFKLAGGTVFKYRRYGFTMHADPQAKTVIRRCREEIVLEEV